MTTRDFQFLVQEDDQARQTITAQSLWMAGRDPSGNLQTSFVTYPGSNPVFIGPLNEDGSVYSDCLNDFYRVWNVRRAQIEFHISDFSDNGQIDNPIEDVIGWPGEGNDHFFDIYGFELPNSTQLAPFLDLDSDGIYEPLDGEYPVEPVDQSIPQYLSWEVHNTLLTDPIFSLEGSVSAEVHLTQWAYLCSDLDILNKTVFSRYEIINRGQTSLEDFKVGIWTDFKLGCGVDDLVGCEPSRNTYFVYNASNIDGENCGNNSDFFGEDAPVQSVSILNQPMNSFVAQMSFNDDFPPELLRACDAQEVFNNLNGLLIDGSPITNVGLGNNENLGDTTLFHFNGDPNNPDEWSLSTVGFSSLEQWYGLASVDIGSWNQGEVITMDVANSFFREPGNNHLENVQAMYEGVDLLQNLYDSGWLQTCSPIECIDDCRWAGDLNNDGIANYVDLVALGFGYN
ncbi:MAG: hypothetical protein AAFN65_12625, partial [Bacteroidota bacterium]